MKIGLYCPIRHCLEQSPNETGTVGVETGVHITSIIGVFLQRNSTIITLTAELKPFLKGINSLQFTVKEYYNNSRIIFPLIFN